MKLLVNASIFSIVFAGFVAGAVTIKPTAQFPTQPQSGHFSCNARTELRSCHWMRVFARHAGSQLRSRHGMRLLEVILGTNADPASTQTMHL